MQLFCQPLFYPAAFVIIADKKESGEMNIQIFGKNKCFDTKKAQRWFKERGIKFQMIDLAQKGMSRGELDSVLKAGWIRCSTKKAGAMPPSPISRMTRTKKKSCSRTGR